MVEHIAYTHVKMSNMCLTTVNSTTAFLLNHPSVAPMYSYNIFTNTWSKKYQLIPISNFNAQIISCVLYQGKNYQRYRLFFVRNIGFLNGPSSFPRANFKVFFNPRDEEISIPETHGPFRNCIPVGVNQAIFLFHASI